MQFVFNDQFNPKARLQKCLLINQLPANSIKADKELVFQTIVDLAQQVGPKSLEPAEQN